MLTKLFRKRGTGKGKVVESTPPNDEFDFNRPLTGQAWIDHENRKLAIAQDLLKSNSVRDAEIRGQARDEQIAKESSGSRYKTPTELRRESNN